MSSSPARRTSRLQKIATLLSLMMLIMVIAAWARSVAVAEILAFGRPEPIASTDSVPSQVQVQVGISAYSHDGLLGLGYAAISRSIAPVPPPLGFIGCTGFADHRLLGRANDLLLGFGFARRRDHYGPSQEIRVTILTIPYWFTLLIAAILPLRSLIMWRPFRRRTRPGGCAACGYDLRASRIRCPECGTPIAEVSEADVQEVSEVDVQEVSEAGVQEVSRADSRDHPCSHPAKS